MVDNAAQQKLAAKLRGTLLRPTSSDYEEARRVWNFMIDRRPALIVRCADAADVVEAVRFARENDLPVSIRGGGHNVAGNAVCDDGLMIDLSMMKMIHVDPERRIARAEPGLTLGEFDAETQKFGLATTLGVVSLTGIAGLTLGGGLGWMMGKYGLACDNLIAAEVVTAEGKLVKASEQENTDLFWALRGGGGNFGVVTSFEYRLYPVSTVLGGLLLHPVSRARELFRFYREAVADIPDELMLHAAILAGPDGNPVCGMAMCYCGPLEEGERLIQPVRKFGPPVADLVGPMPFVEVQKMFDPAFPRKHRNYWKSDFMETVTDEAIDILVEAGATRPSPLATVLLEHMHGAASRVPAAETAFPHRFDQFDFGLLAIWQDAADDEKNIGWTRKYWEALRPYSAKRVYVNYLSQEGPGRVREAYGSNYDRLAAIKRKYDPTNFFRLNQNVQPTG